MKLRFPSLSLAIAAAVFVVSSLANADTESDIRERCAKAKGDNAVAACSWLIHSDKLTGEDLASVFTHRGDAYHFKGDLEGAIADYDQAIKLKPDYFEAWTGRGICRRDNRDFDGAIADFSEAIRLMPHFGFLYYLRGGVYFAEPDYDRAISDYNEALKLKPDYGFAIASRGAAYLFKGDYDRAITDLDQSIKLQVDLQFTYWLRCEARARANRELALALSDCNGSLKLLAGDTSATGARALVLLRMGRYDDAIVDYDAVIEKLPKSAHYLFGRGIARLRKGDATGGNADIANAESIDPKIREKYAKFGMTP